MGIYKRMLPSANTMSQEMFPISDDAIMCGKKRFVNITVSTTNKGMLRQLGQKKKVISLRLVKDKVPLY